MEKNPSKSQKKAAKSGTQFSSPIKVIIKNFLFIKKTKTPKPKTLNNPHYTPQLLLKSKEALSKLQFLGIFMWFLWQIQL